MFSSSWSLLTLSLAAARTYYSQRVDVDADPDPPHLSVVATGCALTFVVTTCYILTWTFVACHAGGYAVLAFVTATVAFTAVTFRTLRVRRALRDSKRRDEAEEEEDELDSVAVHDIYWRGVLTSVLSPCVLGHYKSSMLLVSSLSTGFCLVLWLNMLVPLSRIFPTDRLDRPPISLCFKEDALGNVSSSLAGLVCPVAEEKKADCGESYIRMCSGFDLGCGSYYRLARCNRDSEMPFHTSNTYLRRICDMDENPTDVLAIYIIPSLQLLLLISSLCCGLMHYFGNYYNFYKVTRYRIVYV